MNVSLVKKQQHLLQISVRELHNDTILPSSEEIFTGARTIDGNICVRYMSLRKYIPKTIKPMSDRNKITWGCETCISVMLLQSDINKWRISQLSKLGNLYIDSASTRHLEIYKNCFIE